MKRILTSLILLLTIHQVFADDIRVSSLNELSEAIQKSGNTITLTPGNYDLKNLSSRKRVLKISGSNNTINLTDTKINITVGSVHSSYILLTGDENTIIGGEFEDTYKNGLKKVTDFSAYNKDHRRLASGLRGDPVMKIKGDRNTVNGLKLTVRGSFPYGYGSFYGIGHDQIFGLNKRCGILITGISNTLDAVEIQQRAFGHAIYMQGKADKTLIKNCYIEGRLRKTSELYSETKSRDLPKRSNYRIPRENNKPLAKNEFHSLCEDGIRMYNIPGSVTVENCTVKKMSGGIRLYLGGPAKVENCTVTECEWTGYNLPKHGRANKSTGDFSYAPLSDYRSSRTNTKVEWTILSSPNATGDHNLMDILGGGHHITLNRADGPLDTNETRAIIVSGKGSTIINKTEYAIILTEDARENKIHSFGPVTDHGANNKITEINSLGE